MACHRKAWAGLGSHETKFVLVNDVLWGLCPQIRTDPLGNTSVPREYEAKPGSKRAELSYPPLCGFLPDATVREKEEIPLGKECGGMYFSSEVPCPSVIPGCHHEDGIDWVARGQ